MAEPTQSETAANYGYTLAFFNSNPELKALLARATSQSYSTARFVAELQNTRWFRGTSEAYRKYQALKSGDPSTFKTQQSNIAGRLLTIGAEMGAGLSQAQAHDIADRAMKFGWNEDQMRLFLANSIKAGSDGLYAGRAGAFQQQFTEIAADYGLTISGPTMQSWVRNAALGAQDPQGVKAALQKIAASKYVALKDRILAGETVREIADPYIQSYAKTLEINPEEIGLDDNLVQRALQAKDPKTGAPATQTLYEFEQTLRNDPRWAKTDNARDLAMGTANSILKTFGLSA